MRPIRVLEAELRKVFPEVLEAVHFERQMSQIRLHLYRTACRKAAQLNEFLAAGSFHEDQLRTARRFVSPHFLKPEDIFVELNRRFQVIDSITCMQQFLGLAHDSQNSSEWSTGKGLVMTACWLSCPCT